jgi:hypothetical protein
MKKNLMESDSRQDRFIESWRSLESKIVDASSTPERSGDVISA